MGNLKPISKKQFLVTIGNVSAYFHKATAPSESREENEYNDGQSGTSYTHLGFTKRDKVTLSKTFDPVADKAIVSWYQDRRKNNAEKFTVSIKPVQADQQGSDIPGAATLMLTGCDVSSFKMPEADREGSGMAMLEVVIVHDDWDYL